MKTEISEIVRERIDRFNELIDIYGKITVHQAFYQFISKGWESPPRNRKEYTGLESRLIYACSVGRIKGLISWNGIIDGKTDTLEIPTWKSFKKFIGDAKKMFLLDWWNKSKNLIEVWTEKATLRPILEPITDEYRVPLIVCHGYATIDCIYKRFSNMEASGKKATILYLGDYDGEGWDIYDKIKNGIIHSKYQLKYKPNVERLALNDDQIDRLDLTPLPPKMGSSRTPKFIKERGKQCYEIDAMPPDELKIKLMVGIAKHIDFDEDYYKRKESRERKKLDRLI